MCFHMVLQGFDPEPKQTVPGGWCAAGPTLAGKMKGGKTDDGKEEKSQTNTEEKKTRRTEQNNERNTKT